MVFNQPDVKICYTLKVFPQDPYEDVLATCSLPSGLLGPVGTCQSIHSCHTPRPSHSHKFHRRNKDWCVLRRVCMHEGFRTQKRYE